MARRQHKPEAIVARLRQVEVLVAQGKRVAEGARVIAVTEAPCHRWRSAYEGLKLEQVKRLKQENGKALADLMLEKLVLQTQAGGAHLAP